MAKEDDDRERIEMPDQEAPVKVDLRETDDDDDDKDPADGAPAAAAPPARDLKTGEFKKTRADKRQERGRDREDKWRQEKAQLEGRFNMERQDNDRRFNEMRQEVERLRQNSQQPARGADPFETKLADIAAQMDAELKNIETADVPNYTRYRALQRQEMAVVYAQQAAVEARARAQAPQQGADPYAARRPFMESEFPWAFDARYRDLHAKAQAYKQHLTSIEGKADTMDTDREVLSYIQARFGSQFGLAPPAAAPSQRTRGLYEAPASRGVPPARGDAPMEIEIPAQLVNGAGLSPEALRQAMRGLGK